MNLLINSSLIQTQLLLFKLISSLCLFTDVLPKLIEYMHKFGMMMRIYIPPLRPTLVVSDNRVIQEVVSKNKVWDKAYGYMDLWLGKGILTVSGKTILYVLYENIVGIFLCIR